MSDRATATAGQRNAFRRVAEVEVELAEWRELAVEAPRLRSLTVHACRPKTLACMPALPAFTDLNLPSNDRLSSGR